MGKASKQELFGRLGRAARTARTSLSAELAVLSLQSGQDEALLAVAEAGELTLRDLALRLGVKPPTVTKTVARLVAQGLLERFAVPGGQRQFAARLTPAGTALRDEVDAARGRVASTAFHGIGKRDQRAMAKLLKRVERNLAGPEGPTAPAPDPQLRDSGSSD